MGGYSVLLLLVATATVAMGYVVLEEKAYVQLNDANGQKTINASTYNRLAFDFSNNILYNTAKEPGRLTVFSLLVDGSPVLLKEEVFDTALKGEPLDVEFCQPRAIGGVARLAITFQDPVSASADGTVRLYQPLTPLGGDLVVVKEITVGAQPIDIEFGEDCNVMLVANKGRPTREASNSYRDPEGTVTKILMPFDLNINSPITTTTISFAGLFTGPGSSEYIQLLREGNFRYYPLRQPDSTLLTVMQNIEPHNLVIAPNGLTAYVSLPKNNAIARLNLETNQVSSIFPLGNRSWTDYYMDPSDNDNEVNMRGYNIYSLFQATEMQWVTKEGREWLLTIDTGFLNDIPEYSYSDYQRARILASNGAIMVADSELNAQLNDDTELGRLAVSVEDGKREDGIISNVFTFGGRGFSIHNANNFNTPSAIVDSIEQVTKQYFPSLFNTGYLTDSSTPQSDREASSPFLVRINLVSRTIQSFYQPAAMVSFEVSGKTWLATADTGSIRRYSLRTCKFDESVDARSWRQQFSDGLTPAEISKLQTEMNDNAQLGRMRVSKLKSSNDGWDPVFQGYDFVSTFGGRGFSILDPINMSRVYDSGDDFERYFTSNNATEAEKAVFNGAVGSNSNVMSSQFDRSSPEMGPMPTAIAATNFSDSQLVVIANGVVGGLYYYSVNPGPAVNFEGFTRRGSPGLTWTEAYARDDDSVGEPYVTDMLVVDDEDQKTLVVVSSYAGALSFYNIRQTP